MTTANLSPEAQEKLRAELTMLRSQREGVVDALENADATGDRMDDAEILRRHDEIAMLDDRINELIRLLAGAPLPGPELPEDGPVPGTRVTLRYSDGSEETLRVVAITEEIAPGEEDSVLTLESPLGRALAGHGPGDTVSFRVPDGSVQVEIVEMTPPK
jgi:transcription elongation GreA/GreB family factor